MMKKILMVTMSLIVVCGALNAANPVEKTAKKQAKEWTKQGWRVDGIFTMEEAIYNYKTALAKDEGNKEHTGNVMGKMATKTVNQAKQWAATNAAISYAKEAGVSMKGRIAASMHGSAAENAASDDSFFEAYENLVQKEIQGELKMSFGRYRETATGIEYVAHYIINEEKASQARIRALENLKKENDFARQHAEDLSKFVKEGFQQAMSDDE